MCLQVRETETWMPPKAGESHDDRDSSGDFIFHSDDEDEDTEDYDDMSGSGDDKSSVDEDSDESSKVCEYVAYKSIISN